MDSGERWSGGNVTMLHPGNTPLPITSTGIWDGKTANARLWVVEEWIPLRRATLLTGEGGSGKSLVSQQIATCVALGLPFMGLKTRQLKALYITCEDDIGELQRRQEGICRAVGTSMAELDGNLFFLSRCGDLNNSLLHFHNDGVEQSQFYHDIANFVWTNQIGFLVLDNIAHLFEGNENIRNHVAIFCNAMEALAKEAGATVVFLGHPAKAAGSQFSGSTAWENQVRSRLYLSRPDGNEGAYDDDARVLTRAKSNYAKTGDAIKFRWKDWAFVEAIDTGESWHEQVGNTSKATGENKLFLACLAKATQERRALSHSPHAGNYAPKVMEGMPSAKGLKKEALRMAMERLLHLGEIMADQPLWAGQYRKWMKGIAVANQDCGTVAGRSRNHPANGGQPFENTCGTVVRDGVREGSSILRDGSSQVTDFISGTVAGRLRGGSGASGGQGSPPIGGLPQPPIPEAGDIIWDSADDEEGQ
ncbi:AAA family ATPase [Sphingobium sp.]|uniref:AAA family ATPase n=1 Tax=Sphingobium sp. TaxID=1912891 RepID=UPI003BB62459